MEPQGSKEVCVFSGVFEEVSALQGFSMVPSASSMRDYVENHTKTKYDGTIADDDEWIVRWLSLLDVPREEFESFVSEYAQKGGNFKFDKNEVRKTHWPDKEGWHWWMQYTMDALWVRSRLPLA
ncbi:unnamed protein product [Fusarium graminearum]|nr:unnamed protein product [Fusarium graminearum]